MKRNIRLIIVAIITMMSLSSCASMLPARFDALATNVERHGDNYTIHQWERKNDKFKALCHEYKEHFTEYTRSERSRIHNSMATYVKSAAKSGVVTVADTVTEIANQISELFEDAKAFFQSLGFGKNKE